MRVKLLLFLVSLITGSLSVSSYAQENCSRSGSLWKDYKQFVPSPESPSFVVRVNFIIPQKSDGTGNFSADDAEAIKMLEKSIVVVNKLWSNLKEPKDPDCYTGDDFLDDSFIRFELNEIVFIQDDFYWNGENGSGCPNSRNWYMLPLDELISANPKYANAVNIYMPNLAEEYEKLVIEKTSTAQPKSPPPCSELPSNKELDRSSRINLAGTYNKYWWMKNIVPITKEHNSKLYPWSPTIYGWMLDSFSHTLAHELGHSMGLNHGNEYHGRNKCDESIMNQLHGGSHNYLQPTEIGKIHRDIRMTNIRDFLINDPYSSKALVITDDMELNMAYKSYENIEIRSGATLHIQCEMSLHKDARIIIAPGAKLVVDAKVLSRSTDKLVIITEVQKERWRLFANNKNLKSGELIINTAGQVLGQSSTKKVRRRRN